jgi:hypothetical protein
MKRISIIISCLFLSFTSCKEDSLAEDNPAPSGDNLELNFVPFWGQFAFNFDSMYTNIAGDKFMLDTVSMLIGNVSFYDLNKEYYVDSANNYVKLSNYKTQVVSGNLPADGYYGFFQLVVGTDSLSAANDIQEIAAVDPSFIRDDEFGVNFFRIKGRLLDPASPPDDSVFIDIEYTLGSYLLTDTARSQNRSFSVDNVQNMRLFFLPDLKPVLNYLPMFTVKEVLSDPTDNQDFTISQAMRDSLSIGIF